jgi:hypothetical protein
MSEPLPFRVRLLIALRELDIAWNAKLAGFIVVSHMNDDGKAWPTLETVAREGSISKGSARTGVELLVGVGFLAKVSSRKGNTYLPQMTPELERLVDGYLDRARRRRGQLPLPLDGRGLALADGSRGDQRRSRHDHQRSPGDQRRSRGDHEVVSEVVSKVVTEIGTAEPVRENEPEDLSNPLVALVSDIADADDYTLHVFQRRFAGLSDWAIEHAHDELRRRRKNSRRGPLDSEARYAFDALQRKTGRRDRSPP